MAEWVDRLKSKQAQLIELAVVPSSQRAARVLTRMRAGTLDWRATLDARQAHRPGRRGAASQLATWQRRVVTRLDELLLTAGEALGPAKALEAPAETSQSETTPAETASAETASVETAPAEAVETALAAASAPAEKAPALAETAPAEKAKPAPAPRKRPSAKRGATTAKTANEPPLEAYDTLTAKQIVSKSRGLDDRTRALIREYELTHKARKTVLRAVR